MKEFLEDLFDEFGPVTVKRMFGGYGVYHRGLMFALVAEGTLYLKTDPGNVGHFLEKGLEIGHGSLHDTG